MLRRATIASVTKLLRGAGATEEESGTIVAALDRAGLDAKQMRVWLSHDTDAHAVSTTKVMDVDWLEVPTDAIRTGHAPIVVAAAEAFAAASPEDRWVCLTLGCRLEEARRLTQGEAERTALVIEILQILSRELGRPAVVYETIQQIVEGDWPDGTRFVDWMLDGRLADVRDSLVDGRIDPKVLHRQDGLLFTGW